MSAANIQGVQWVPGMHDSIVNWSTDLKLYKITVGPREYAPASNSDIVAEYIVNCPALKSELISRITETPHYTKCAAVSPVLVLPAPLSPNASLSVPTSPKTSPPAPFQPLATSELANALPPVATTNSTHSDVKVAVGQANGRISLLSFYAGGAAIKEFGPKSGRACNDLAWNPKFTNYLAAAYDKSRNDHSILIFDTALAPPSQTEASSSAVAKIVSKTSTSKDFIRASIEVGLGEQCHSLAWFHKNPETLIAGMNMKNLKIFDMRLSTHQNMGPKPLKTNVTRNTLGLCIDPHMDYRVASYCDETVVIWDTRNFDKPILTKPQSADVVQLAWSPTRSGLLCSLTKGSTDTLTLHDIQSWAVMTEDGEPAVTQRAVNVLPLEYPDPVVSVEQDVEIDGKDIITSFAWHPSEENCLVASRKDGRLAEVHVMERIAPSWSSQHFLVWPHNGTLRSHDRHNQFFADAEDISIQMQERAKNKCFKPWKPFIHDPEDKYLGWHVKLSFDWLESCKLLMEDLAFSNQFTKEITAPGIRTAMGLDRGKGTAFVLKSDITYKQWNMGSNATALDSKGHRTKRMFKGDARHRALKLCGWGTDESELKIFLNKLEGKKQFARAAALAVFNLEIRLALQILEKVDEKEETLQLVAMALAGFSEEKAGQMWRDMVASLVKKLQNPYFRSMFEFLLIMVQWNGSDQESFSSILNEEGLMPTDRVAFACLYLPDEKLSDYINTKWLIAKRNGDISSIYLCGASGNEAIELLQQYVDVTGDIQTVSWICIHYMPSELVNAQDAPQAWITSYRKLLEAWAMFVDRAAYDNACYSANINKPIMQQVYVSCNYCGKPVSKHTYGMPEGAIPAVNNASNETKKVQAALNMAHLNKHQPRFQTCPACRKPCPRCSVCMMNMGSNSGYFAGQSHMMPSGGKTGKKITPFGSFFSWCQTCRHGGHCDHMEDWFELYRECPVSNCQCRCNELDKEIDPYVALETKKTQDERRNLC